jgi:hypothetical protein
MINSKQIYANEETGFIFQKYSGFAPKAFIKEVRDRDFVKISLDLDQESCVKLENTLNEYDDSFESSRKTVFGKYDRLYKFSLSVKKPKSNSEEISEDEDEDEEVEKESKETKETQPKFNSCKMKLKMDWYYYHQGDRLNKSNTNIVKKAVTDSMNKNKTVDKEKRKALLSTLTFKLNFKDENNKTVQKDVKMDELEQKREIDSKVFYRRPQTLPPNAQEFLKKLRGTSLKEIEEYIINAYTFYLTKIPQVNQDIIKQKVSDYIEQTFINPELLKSLANSYSSLTIEYAPPAISVACDKAGLIVADAAPT